MSPEIFDKKIFENDYFIVFQCDKIVKKIKNKHLVVQKEQYDALLKKIIRNNQTSDALSSSLYLSIAGVNLCQFLDVLKRIV